MSHVWKVIANAGRWVWKNSWWIVPAGEEVYQTLKRKFKRSGNNEDNQKI